MTSKELLKQIIMNPVMEKLHKKLKQLSKLEETKSKQKTKQPKRRAVSKAKHKVEVLIARNANPRRVKRAQNRVIFRETAEANRKARFLETQT